ncbi:MAG: PDZ domain-containing protein [Planctomycetota bacterium]
MSQEAPRRGPGGGEQRPEPSLGDSVAWRCVGPSNMGGRVVDFAVSEQDPSMFWIATASGGLLKTVNNGITFTNQFDHESTVSIGDVCVAPSNHDIVWVGTGENNPRNSVSYGDGVYKSVDGGKTWKNMGLKDSFQIGRIAIHPTNPDIVYVGALGRLWGASEERGLYKTTDGGQTWQRILYVDDKTGVIDVEMQPGHPDQLLVATYERMRDGTDDNDPIKKIGPGSGLYLTTDGGASFTKVTQGLPSGALGRIGVDFYRKDPSVVYAIVEAEQIGKIPDNAGDAGITTENGESGARVTRVTADGPAASAGIEVGDIVLRVNDATVLSSSDLQEQIRSREAGETVQIEVARAGKSKRFDVVLAKASEDVPPGRGGGRRRGGGPGAAGEPGREGERPQEAAASAADRPAETPGEAPAEGADELRRNAARTPFSSGLGGQRENIQRQQGKQGQQYGGLYRSSDGGQTWTRINSLNPRPMYFSQVRVDPSDANYIYVLGISMYRSSDGGATFTDDAGNAVHPDQHALWVDPRDGRHLLVGCDGGAYVSYDRCDRWDHLNHVAIGQFYHVAVDPRRDYRVYGGLQDNGTWGASHRSRTTSGPINEDWISVGGGDGLSCRWIRANPTSSTTRSQNGGMGRINLRTGERGGIRPPRGQRGTRYRFNWKTPFILSNHNSRIFYAAAQVSSGRSIAATTRV